MINPANAPTERFFASVGIKPGMRVLDVGCGSGDLSRFVAELAGSDGEVVAIDRSDEALVMARSKPISSSGASIQYRTVELSDELPDLGQFDAIVGRRVLMYLPEPASTIARLKQLARPNAILAFQEHARSNLPAGLGRLELHSELYDWMWSTVAAEGGDVGLALRLLDLFRAEGFAVEQARSEGILLQSGEPSFLPTLTELMLPRFVECGVASAEDVGLETLAGRLEEERRRIGGTIVWDLAFLVSARLGT